MGPARRESIDQCSSVLAVRYKYVQGLSIRLTMAMGDLVRIGKAKYD
jgi:hypothetical protein